MFKMSLHIILNLYKSILYGKCQNLSIKNYKQKNFFIGMKTSNFILQGLKSKLAIKKK
jgi:hypothetical protein